MENNQGMPLLKVPLQNTEKIESLEGGVIFQEGYILRKASKFLTGTTEDQLIPIPVMYDVKTGKILKQFIPKEIQEDYINHLM